MTLPLGRFPLQASSMPSTLGPPVTARPQGDRRLKLCLSGQRRNDLKTQRSAWADAQAAAQRRAGCPGPHGEQRPPASQLSASQYPPASPEGRDPFTLTVTAGGPGATRGAREECPPSWRRRVLRWGKGRDLLENTSELGQMELEPRPPSFQARTPPTSLLSPTQPGAWDNYCPSKTFSPSFA